MNDKIEVGKLNTLRVNRVSEPGIYLISKEDEEILLPNAYVTSQMQIDSLLDVFVYTDSEDRLVSTTLKPYLYLNEFSYLEVVDIANFGAFVDIGLPKDILVPKNRQKSSFSIGGRKVLQLQLDELSNRLIASEKFQLDNFEDELSKNDEVEILIYSKTPLGFKVIVNNRFEGMVYHNEVFEHISIGDKKRAYLKNIRDDKKLDISLQKIGQKSQEDKVYEILVQNGGQMRFTYKSNAQDIKDNFGISKKSFKASLTKLIDSKKIDLSEEGIRVKS